MTEFSFSEMRLIISNSSRKDKIIIPKKIFHHRINLIKTIKTYIKKYYNFAENKNNILYLSILYLDIIISKDKINLTNDKNLKYLCLCCFILSLKFLGDYDLSKKIIRNFCLNYKEEYNIFEIQCIQLLNYNLIYTTAYDYLNMMLNKDQKKLITICNSILNKICEDDLYLFYSPFYIAIVVMQLGKNYLHDKSYNYYDKYFNEQRVIFLYKAFNQDLNINPPIKINLDEYNINNINNKILYEKKNYKNYFKNQMNNINNTNIQNINIFTNNTIQNNIVIINEIRNDENKENINLNNINNINNNNNYCTKTYLKTINSNINKNPLKIIVNRYNKNYNNNINTDKNYLNYNYNNNTYRISRIRPHKSKNENSFRCRNNFNNGFNFDYNKSLNKNDIDENDNISYQIKHSFGGGNIKNQNKSTSNLNRKIIYPTKSSLNFKLLSNVPKEVLFKLSKNISKTFGSSIDKITVNRCNNYK